MKPPPSPPSWVRRRLLAQAISDSTPKDRDRGGNPIRAAGLLILALVVLVGGALLGMRGCG